MIFMQLVGLSILIWKCICFYLFKDIWDEAKQYAETTCVRTTLNYATHQKFELTRDFKDPIDAIDIFSSDEESEPDGTNRSSGTLRFTSKPKHKSVRMNVNWLPSYSKWNANKNVENA